MGLKYHTTKKHGLIKIDLYRKDEPRGSAENKDDEQIYLSKSQINYPLFNVKLSGSKAAGLDLEPNSDYEVIFCCLLTYFGIIYLKNYSQFCILGCGYKPDWLVEKQNT